MVTAMMRGPRLQKLRLHLRRLPPPLLPRLELAQRLRRRRLPQRRPLRLRRRGRQRLGRRPGLQARLPRRGAAVPVARRRARLRLRVAPRAVAAAGVGGPVAVAAQAERVQRGADGVLGHRGGGVVRVGVAGVEEGVAGAAFGEAAGGAVVRVGAAEGVVAAGVGVGGVGLVAVDGDGAGGGVGVEVEVVGEVCGFGGGFGGGGGGECEAGVGEVEHGVVVVADGAFEEGDDVGGAVAVGVEAEELGVGLFGGGLGVFEALDVGDVLGVVGHAWVCSGWVK